MALAGLGAMWLLSDWAWLIECTWHHTSGWIRAFHSWGNLATVTVAIAAIIVASRNNKKTLQLSALQFDRGREDTREALRLSASQFHKAREDSRDDKVRAEIASLIDRLGERVSQRQVLLRQVRGLADEQRTQNAAAVFSEVLAGTYRRIGVHISTILMLTNDTNITQHVNRIGEEVARERVTFELLLLLSGIAADNPIARLLIVQIQQQAPQLDQQQTQREQVVDSEREQLRLYCVEKWAS